MGQQALGTERHFIITLTNVGTAEVVELDFGAPLAGTNRTLWDLVYFGFERTGGSATTYDPKVSETNPPAATDEECRMLYGAAITVATITRDQFDPPLPFAVDANGKLYFAPGFDAGADNDAVVVLRFVAKHGRAIEV